MSAWRHGVVRAAEATPLLQNTLANCAAISRGYASHATSNRNAYASSRRLLLRRTKARTELRMGCVGSFSLIEVKEVVQSKGNVVLAGYGLYRLG